MMRTKQTAITNKKPKIGLKHDLYIRLKRSTLRILFILCSIFIIPNHVFAQKENSITENFDINLDIKNMHLWHGSVVTPGIMMASSIEFKSNNQNFVLGLWGGASANGDYKEFSYYTTYKFTSNFNVSLISHNNYSNSEEVNIFSYNKHTSPNFVDIVFEYTLSEKTPLTLYWSTILFGNGGDYQTNNNGSENDSYSTYTELSYPFFQKRKTQLKIFAGGAFALATQKTFYSKQANMVNIGLTLSQDVDFLSRKFPVSATAFWNPESKTGALQLDIKLF